MAPTNQNILQGNGFLVTINRLPNTSYWCSGVELPGITASNPEQPNPFSRLPIPADRGDFDALSINFNVDEDMKNWAEIMRWFVGFSFPKDFSQFSFGVLDDTGDYPGSQNNFYSDISVTVLSSHKNPIATFMYYNCIPTSLSSISLNVATQDVEPLFCTATFDFSHFEILKPGTSNPIE